MQRDGDNSENSSPSPAEGAIGAQQLPDEAMAPMLLHATLRLPNELLWEIGALALRGHLCADEAELSGRPVLLLLPGALGARARQRWQQMKNQINNRRAMSHLREELPKLSNEALNELIVILNKSKEHRDALSDDVRQTIQQNEQQGQVPAGSGAGGGAGISTSMHFQVPFGGAPANVPLASVMPPQPPPVVNTGIVGFPQQQPIDFDQMFANADNPGALRAEEEQQDESGGTHLDDPFRLETP